MDNYDKYMLSYLLSIMMYLSIMDNKFNEEYFHLISHILNRPITNNSLKIWLKINDNVNNHKNSKSYINGMFCAIDCNIKGIIHILNKIET